MYKRILFLRFLAFCIDLMVVGVVGALLMFAFDFFEIPNFSFEVSVLLLLLKDLYSSNGSIGKSLIGLKVTYDGMGNYSIIKFLRNITMFIYPIELLVAYFNQGKRIGDMLFSTEVISTKEAAH